MAFVHRLSHPLLLRDRSANPAGPAFHRSLRPGGICHSHICRYALPIPENPQESRHGGNIAAGDTILFVSAGSLRAWYDRENKDVRYD